MSTLTPAPLLDDDVAALVARRTPGLSLEQRFSTDPVVHLADLERIWSRTWLFATHSCEIPNAGDYVTLDVGNESLVVIRAADGAVRAHFNVCRHRGSRVVCEPRGHAKAFVCPYHQWAYRPDGSLAAARLMGDGLDRTRLGLHPAAVREVAGLVFVTMAPEPPDFEGFAAALAPQVGPHRLDRAKVVARHSYAIAANWKTVVENNRECYHCRGGHPEFTLSNFDLGVNGDSRSDERYARLMADSVTRWERMGLAPREVSFPDGSWYRVARLPLKPGFDTESMDGRLLAPPMGEVPQSGAGSLRVVTLPNLWAHANADYTMTTRILPGAVDRTDVEVAFLVDADAVPGRDVDPDALAHVWRRTADQDRELCERNYAGIRSSRYEPGPLSTVTENSVEAFLDWYLRQLAGER